MAQYVNNNELVAALEKYKEDLKNDPNTRLPEYVGKCILDIATRFSTRPNFYAYSYRDEMISDAIENCIKYISNFDTAKSRNAFAYITQICHFAFIHRINKEKKQSYIKYKLVQDIPSDSFEFSEHDDKELSQNFMSYIQSNNQFDGSSFEKNIEKKKTKKKTPIENLMGEEDNE